MYNIYIYFRLAMHFYLTQECWRLRMLSVGCWLEYSWVSAWDVGSAVMGTQSALGLWWPSPSLALQLGSPAALGALCATPSANAPSSSLDSSWSSSSASGIARTVWSKLVRRGPQAATTTSAKTLSALAATPSSRAFSASPS